MPSQTPTQRKAALDAAGLDSTQQSGVNAGIGYAAPTTLNSSNLNQQSQVQLPQQQPDTNDYLGVGNGTNATIAAHATNLAPTVNPDETKKDPSADMFSWMQNELKQANTNLTQNSGGNLYNSLYSSSPIDANQKAANDAAQAQQVEQGKLAALQASLTGKNYEFNTVIPNQAQQDAVGRNGTQAGVQATTVSQQRQKLLEIAPLQLQVLSQQAAVAAAQGNTALAQGILQSAQSHLDKVFQIQSQDAQAQYDYQTKKIEAVYNFASAQEKAKLDAQQHKADQDHADQQADTFAHCGFELKAHGLRTISAIKSSAITRC